MYPAFEGVAFSLWFFPAYFYPYYFLFALAGLLHASNGWLAVMQLCGVRLKKDRFLIPVSLTGAIMILTSLLSFGGVFFDIGDPAQSDYAQLVAQQFGFDVNQPWK